MNSIPKQPLRGNGPGPKLAPPPQFAPQQPVWPEVASGGQRAPQQGDRSPWEAISIVEQLRVLLNDYFEQWGMGYSAELDERYQDLLSQLLKVLEEEAFSRFTTAAAVLHPTVSPTKIVGSVAHVTALLPPALGFFDRNAYDSWWHTEGRRC